MTRARSLQYSHRDLSRLIATGLLCAGLILAAAHLAGAQRTSADNTQPYQRKASGKKRR